MRLRAGRLKSSTSEFSPLQLFADNEVGAWYDPSDLTTLFQDVAGTTPVTAAGQSVALMLDKSRNAVGTNGAFRRNIFFFSVGTGTAWSPFNTFATANSTQAPDGTITGVRLNENVSTNQHYTLYDTATAGISLPVSVTRTLSYHVKPDQRTRCRIGLFSAGFASGFFAVFNLGTGTLTSSGASGSGSVSTATIQALANGWFRVTVTGIASTSDTTLYPVLSILDDSGNTSYLGIADRGFWYWGAQLENNTSATTYQYITSSWPATMAGNHATQATAGQRPTYQVDANGKAHLLLDGTDDNMLTGTITLSSVDKVQVFAGVRKSSDAARGTIAEYTASIAANNGAWHLTAPNAASATFAFESKGTTLTDAVTPGFVAPTTRVVTGLSDISGDNTVIRVNGVQAASNTGDQGTGNFSNSVLYIGRRSGTTLPFSGNIYSLIVRFSSTNLISTLITNTETWINIKTNADYGVRLIQPGAITGGGFVTFSRSQVAMTSSALSSGGGGNWWTEYAANVPRFGGTANRLMLEGQRTTVNVRQRLIGGTGWALSDTTSTTTTGPDGGAATASRIDEGVTTSTHLVSLSSIVMTAGVVYSMSAIVKAETCTSCQFLFGSAAFGNNAWQNFDLASGVLGTGGAANINPRIVSLSGGWYWISLSALCLASVGAPTAAIYMTASASAGRASAHTGTSRTMLGFWAWTEAAASFPSSAILAASEPATATRGQDNFTSSFATLFPTGVGTALGSFLLPFASVDADQALLDLNDGTLNSRIRLRNVAGGNTIVMGRTIGGVNIDAASLGNMAPGTLFRVGITFDGTNIVANLNGGSNQSVAGYPTGLTALRIGNNSAGTEPMFGEIGYFDTLPYVILPANLPAAVTAIP